MNLPRSTQTPEDESALDTLPGEAASVGLAVDPEQRDLVDSDAAAHIVLGERYEVLGLLGSGGMGSVYRVRDLQLDTTVALKLMRGDWSRPADIERFRQEVKLARRVTHRNVVRTFDAGVHGADRFVTLEFIEGESLASWLAREGRLQVSQVLAVARELAEGLAAAHTAGVLHLDLKPENVLLEIERTKAVGPSPDRHRLPAGVKRVVVTDFGIARAAESTGTLGFVGTPAYMAPEQVEGSKVIDPRADVYAFGALLFELLTGHAAWTGGTIFAVALARLSSPPPDVRVHRPELMEDLADAVRAMMARSPEDRPRDGGAVAALLDALLTPLHEEYESPSASDELRARARRIAPTAYADRSVAVMPVRVIPEDDVLADELTEDLIDRLAMARALRVRSYGTTRAALSSGRDARDLGRRLDVDVVVELTVRRGDPLVRVGARVIGIADGFQLWAQRFETTPGELLTLNDRVAAAVTEAFSREGSAAERAPLAHPQAIERYITARNALRQAWTGLRPFAPVLASFEEARSLAPDDPMILSGAAMARARAANYNQASATARIEARTMAERAILLAPASSEPWFACASLDHVDGRWPEAVSSLRRALAVNAAYLPAQRLLASIQGEVGPIDDAILRFDIVAELEPMTRYAALVQSQLHLLAGRVDECLRSFPRAICEEDERHCSIFAARLNLWLGEERFTVTEPMTKVSTFYPVQILRDALRRDPQAALELQMELERAPVVTRFRLLLIQLATEIAAGLDRREDALGFVESAANAGLYDATWLDGCPLFAALRPHPRFIAARELVERRAAEVRVALTRPL